MADFCIVSRFDINKVDALSPDTPEAENFPGVAIEVAKAPWDKCVRCWKLHPDIGKEADYPGVCPRCANVLKKYLS